MLVHADFKPGNLLLAADRVTALLGLELAHLGDSLDPPGAARSARRPRRGGLMPPTVDERLQGVERLLAAVATDPALPASSADLVANARRLVQQVSSSWSSMLGFYVGDNAKMLSLLGLPAQDAGLDVHEAERTNERLRAELARVITDLPRDAEGRRSRDKMLAYLRERTDECPA